jgi:hypothetical protein
MAEKRNGVSAALASGIICLALGAAGGYYSRYWVEDEIVAKQAGGRTGTIRAESAPRGAGVSGMRSMGPAGPGGPGGMAGGAGRPGENQTALAGLIRGLATIQAAQGKGLSPDQLARVVPILKQVRAAGKMPDADCKARLDALQQVLTDGQKQVLQRLTRRRAGPQGGGAGPGGGPPASPDEMFRQGPAAQSIDELLKSGG